MGCGTSTVQEIRTNKPPSSPGVRQYPTSIGRNQRNGQSNNKATISVTEKVVEKFSPELGSVHQSLPFGEFGGDLSLGVTVLYTDLDVEKYSTVPLIFIIIFMSKCYN